jgi:hypothetical protein
MSIAILTANLGNFDTPVDPPTQTAEFTFHRFTDEDFPPITGLTPRLQYRIPKTHGWQMKPGHNVYLWMDGTFTLGLSNSLAYLWNQLGDADILLFKHPNRDTITEEVQHIESHLKAGKPYITSRYKNGLHKEQLQVCLSDLNFTDDRLFTSTVFMYRDNPRVRQMMVDWLFTSVRYFTCDQIALPYLVWKHKLKIKVIEENQYQFPHLQEVSKHR